MGIGYTDGDEDEHWDGEDGDGGVAALPTTSACGDLGDNGF